MFKNIKSQRQYRKAHIIGSLPALPGYKVVTLVIGFLSSTLTHSSFPRVTEEIIDFVLPFRT